MIAIFGVGGLPPWASPPRRSQDSQSQLWGLTVHAVPGMGLRYLPAAGGLDGASPRSVVSARCALCSTGVARPLSVDIARERIEYLHAVGPLTQR